VVLHIACPRFLFFDRGKGSVDLPDELAIAVSHAVVGVTREWADIKRKREREQHAAARREEELLREGRRRDRVTIEEASRQVIPDAYRTASAGPDGQPLPVKGRQVMYAARGRILELTGLTEFDGNSWIQRVLFAYIREHPDECKDWDVICDARGHLTEPHTGHSFGLGTMEVRDYLKQIAMHAAVEGALARELDVPTPEISMRYPTRGPRNRYGALLFVEKEGFNELFTRVRLEERYDIAIASSKGMGSTAVRQLFEELWRRFPGLKILVMRDLDKSGFSIAGTLKRNTARFRFEQPPGIIDLGLRLADVRRYRLPSEPQDHKSDPGPNLKENGATEEEIEFLRGERYHYRNRKGRMKEGFHGQRVELNAFTNAQLLEWLEAKLKAHDVQKVIPNDATLEQDFRRKVALREFRRRMEELKSQAEEKAREAKIPKDLRQQIERKLEAQPTLAWDDEDIMPEE
jgi:hypothetical protein